MQDYKQEYNRFPNHEVLGGGAIAGAANVQAQQRQPAVPAAMERLTNCTKFIVDRTERLLHRIDPVLRQQPPATSTEKMGVMPTAGCPFADQLENLALMLSQIGQRLDDAGDRVEM